MSKFLLLLGPSGVGKSSIIEELIRLDDRFVYISPYTTRPLRAGEVNKISIGMVEMKEMEKQGKFLVINKLYDISYATPRTPIEEALTTGKFPVLDWPVSNLRIMTSTFPARLFLVYISPPSIEVLKKRLSKDGRDGDGKRLKRGQEELEVYWSSQHAQVYDLEVVAEENMVSSIANEIYKAYRKSIV
jgi:guanylate kinase